MHPSWHWKGTHFKRRSMLVRRQRALQRSSDGDHLESAPREVDTLASNLFRRSDTRMVVSACEVQNLDDETAACVGDDFAWRETVCGDRHSRGTRVPDWWGCVRDVVTGATGARRLGARALLERESPIAEGSFESPQNVAVRCSGRRWLVDGRRSDVRPGPCDGGRGGAHTGGRSADPAHCDARVSNQRHLAMGRTRGCRRSRTCECAEPGRHGRTRLLFRRTWGGPCRGPSS